MEERKEAFNELALFAGAGGGILGGLLHGWRTVAAVEIEDYPRRVLLQRQADGILPRFPIWDNVETFDGKQWRGKVDIITGGFPCQDISAAGKGAGIEGKKSGLWKEMARIIDEVQPSYALMENSPLLMGRGLALVISDLTQMGYDAQWCIIGASDVGAPHQRNRLWIMANAAKKRNGFDGYSQNWKRSFCFDSIKRSQKRMGFNVSSLEMDQSDSMEKNTMGNIQRDKTKDYSGFFQKWQTEPDVGRVVNGMADWMDRISAIGNGQVPRVAALACKILALD